MLLISIFSTSCNVLTDKEAITTALEIKEKSNYEIYKIISWLNKKSSTYAERYIVTTVRAYNEVSVEICGTDTHGLDIGNRFMTTMMFNFMIKNYISYIYYNNGVIIFEIFHRNDKMKYFKLVYSTDMQSFIAKKYYKDPNERRATTDKYYVLDSLWILISPQE